MEKFPEVRDTLMKEPGKEFYVYISGKISYDVNGTGTILPDRIEIITEPEGFFQGSGTVKYANLEGGAFIFTEAIAAPMPLIDEGGTVLPSPTVTNPRSFVLFGMDKFPKIKEQILKEPGKDLYCFISGEISNEPSIFMMESLKIYKIELFISE